MKQRAKALWSKEGDKIRSISMEWHLDIEEIIRLIE